LAELDRENSSLEKVLEAAISYEQVLLSQISYCAKLTNLLNETLSNEGTQYIYNNTRSLIICVDNLISLLPKDLRLKVFSREWEIRKRIADYANNYKCLKDDTCSEKDLENIELEVLRVMRKELPEYSHIISYIIRSVVRGKASSVGVYQFRLALVVDVLMEEGIIGLKQSSLFVGRVDVPK